jgi:hypothetical protein
MAINFPSSPTPSQIFTDPTTGTIYVWNGEVWLGYGDLSGGSLTGVGSRWNITNAGIHTLSNVGIGTTNPRVSLEVGSVGTSGTSLLVNGDARITGILSVGQGTVTINGSTNKVNVGSLIEIDGSIGNISASSFSGDGTSLVGVATVVGLAAVQSQVNALGTNLNVIGFYDALSGVVTSLTVVGQTRSYTGIGQTLNNVGIVTGDYFIVSTGGVDVGIATYTTVGITSVYPGDWIVGVDDNSWSILSYSQQVVAPRATRSDFAGTLESDSTVNTTGTITASAFYGNGVNLTGVVTSLDGYATETYVGNALNGYATENYVDNAIVGFVTSGGGGESYWASTSAGIHTLSNVGIGTTNPTSTLTVKGVTSLETLNVSGVSNFYDSSNFNEGAFIPNDKTLTFGTSLGQPALSIEYLPSPFFLNAITSNANLVLGVSNELTINSASGTNTVAKFRPGYNNVELYYAGDKKFETVGAGVTITGTTVTDQLNVSGISTFNGKVRVNNSNILLGDGSEVTGNQIKLGNGVSPDAFGDSADLWIYHNPSFGNLFQDITGTGIRFLTNDFRVRHESANADTILTNTTGNNEVKLYQGGNLKFETLGTGVTVTGTTFTNNLSVSQNAVISGILTATQINGTIIGSIDNAVNLTGGTANASSLNVSGITTISQGRIQADAAANLRFGNIAAGSGSPRNIAIGDQVLVSLSGGSGRNIGIGELSYYDTTTGQYNIGIGERAGQKVTTGAYNVIIGAYDGNSQNLDIRTSSNNVVIADGQGNIRQYINSSGNVGIKTTVITNTLTVGGSVTATSYSGSASGLTSIPAGQIVGQLPAIDGSKLIGVTATGTGVEVRDDNAPIGTAGTINFGTNLAVSFAAGIATISGPTSIAYASVAGLATTATNAQGLIGSPNIGVTYLDAVQVYVGDCTSLVGNDNKIVIGQDLDFEIFHLNDPPNEEATWMICKDQDLFIGNKNGSNYNAIFGVIANGSNPYARLNHGFSRRLETTGYGVTVFGGLNATGIITASSFSGSASGLTNLPSAQLTGALPAIDGSALINLPAQPGDGVVVWDDTVNVGSARTLDFGTGLDVTISNGIATVTSSGGSLQSRTIVTGVTTSIANNGIGNTNITGFKSYALMKVGLSTAGWLRLYTDSASRDADVFRSVGEDPQPGSGVIAEVVTTGISTTQIISPFVMGGNLDNPADTTIYASIKNLSGSTQAITANLTILQLEA